MDPAAPNPVDPSSRSKMVDTVLQIGLLGLLIYACARIVLPFAGILVWSMVLAVMLHPVHVRLASRIGNRWSAGLIGVVGVVVTLIPIALVAASLASSAHWLISGLENHSLVMPPPPARLADLPLVGDKLSETWVLILTDVPSAVAKYGGKLSRPAAWLASFAARLAVDELSFVLSFAIAAVLLAYGRGAAAFAEHLLEFMTGNGGRGPRLAKLTAATVRGVAVGVVGVAAIQSVLLGVGFFAIGLPGAGLLMVIALFLGILQVPATLLTVPVIIYVFVTHDTVPAVIFLIWTLIAGLSDNALKPLMLGRGLEVPMPVILIGVIGGLLADGMLGLFVGPVVLAVGYVLFMEWVQLHPPPETTGQGDDPPTQIAP
jgi:predicted PurR-regulated permease PerM